MVLIALSSIHAREQLGDLLRGLLSPKLHTEQKNSWDLSLSQRIRSKDIFLVGLPVANAPTPWVDLAIA